MCGGNSSGAAGQSGGSLVVCGCEGPAKRGTTRKGGEIRGRVAGHGAWPAAKREKQGESCGADKSTESSNGPGATVPRGRAAG